MKSIFVSPLVFDWDPDVSSWTYIPKKTRRREYAIWQHAADLLQGADTPDARGDCVNALNRVVDQRAKKLDERYSISKVFGSRRTIDNLHTLGVLRRDMILQINRVRNLFEHTDRKPPSFDRLGVFVELVWYFLRSTDTFLYFPRSGIQLSPSGALDQDADRVDIQYSGKTSFPWRVSLVFENASLYSLRPVSQWPEFLFADRQLRMQEGRMWASDGTMPSKDWTVKLLGKFFET